MDELLKAGIHWKIINFSLFVIGLMVLLRRPFREYWATRREEIVIEMELAMSKKRESEETHCLALRRWENIKTESSQVVHSLTEEGELIKKQLLQEAESLAERIQNEAKLLASQELTRSRMKLRQQVITLAMEKAETVLKEKTTPQDQERLLGRFEKDVNTNLVSSTQGGN